MTTAVEMPKTIRRALMVGFNIELNGQAPVEVPITHFTYHAALDEDDKPIADYLGVYQGVIQLCGEHGYFWKALAFEIEAQDQDVIDSLPTHLTPEERKGHSYHVRFVELLDLTSVDGRAQTRTITPVFVFIDRPIADTANIRNNDGQLKPEWTLTSYSENAQGDRKAEMVSSTGAKATLRIDRSNKITEIFVNDDCLKSDRVENPAIVPNAFDLISQIEYSYMVQRYAKALTGKENPIVAAGKVDLSEIAAPTYVIAAEIAHQNKSVPEAALLDCDSSEVIVGVDPAKPGADTTAQTDWGSDTGTSSSND